MLRKISFDLFVEKISRKPEAENYLDTLLNSDPDYRASYQFFGDEQNNLLGLSPENNLHVYTQNEEVIQNFMRDKNFNLIFSLYSNHFLFADKKVKAFYYLNKTPIHTEEDSLLLADRTHQSFVNNWYAEFNKEEGSNWETPDLAKQQKGRLFLFEHDNQIVGGASNTLVSNSRLWIGRLWIDPRYRSMGHGLRFMRALENIAYKENKKVSLLVTDTNERALALYKKLNYSEIALNAYWYNS